MAASSAHPSPGRPVDRLVRDVTAHGVRMRVVEAGAGHGPPVVLVHGFLTSHLAFDDVIDDLAQRFHVIAPDLPGFGESEKPSPARYAYGVEAFAEAIADLIAAYQIGRAHIIGHSMGGAVGLTLGALHAELVQRLVLVDALCYPFRLPLRLRIPLMPVIGSFAFKQLYGRGTFRAHFREDVYGPRADVPLLRVDRHYDLFNTPSARESAFAVMRSILDTRPVVARLSRINIPSLVVWGCDDTQLPPSYAQRLAREVRGAKLQILDAGHAPHEERPREFVSTVTEFLEGRR
jgi:pimeloyl-ACP methyl ester carboxylesterase